MSNLVACSPQEVGVYSVADPNVFWRGKIKEKTTTLLRGMSLLTKEIFPLNREGWPDVPFLILCDKELMNVVSKSKFTYPRSWIVERGMFGTSVANKRVTPGTPLYIRLVEEDVNFTWRIQAKAKWESRHG